MGEIYHWVLDLPRLTTKHSRSSEFSDPPRFLLRPESRRDHSEVEEELEEKIIFCFVGLELLMIQFFPTCEF